MTGDGDSNKDTVVSTSKGGMEVVGDGAREKTAERTVGISSTSMSVPSLSTSCINSSSGDKATVGETITTEVVGLSTLNGSGAMDGEFDGTTQGKTTNEANVEGVLGVVTKKAGATLVESGKNLVLHESPTKGANKKGVDTVGYKTTPAVVVSKAAVGKKSVSGLGSTVAKNVEVDSCLRKEATAVTSIKDITSSSSKNEVHVTDKGEQEGWTKVQGKKNGYSPKRNPFMVYRYFTDESRFPINKVRAAEIASSSRPKIPIEDTNSFQDLGEDDEELTDIEFERNLKLLTCEEKESKRRERELRRINWNGKNGNPNVENFGRGQRSQAKDVTNKVVESLSMVMFIFALFSL